MLLEKEDLLLAKLIGLVNGLTNESDITQFSSLILNALNALKNKENLDGEIDILIQAKKDYLPNCLICQFPCGRTNDYHLNNLSKEEYKEKEALYQELLNKFNDIEFSEVCYMIEKLSW